MAQHWRCKNGRDLTITCPVAGNKRSTDHPVEAILGPDIPLHDVTYIVTEPKSKFHLSWRQDLTYWGFNSDDQVSLWLALSLATAESGCMRMIPGRHKQGTFMREPATDETNVLLQEQTVRHVPLMARRSVISSRLDAACINAQPPG